MTTAIGSLRHPRRGQGAAERHLRQRRRHPARDALRPGQRLHRVGRRDRPRPRPAPRRLGRRVGQRDPDRDARQERRRRDRRPLDADVQRLAPRPTSRGTSTGADLQVALRLLPTINGANVTVTGDGPYAIEFIGTLAGLAQSLMTADATGLTVSPCTATVVLDQHPADGALLLRRHRLPRALARRALRLRAGRGDPDGRLVHRHPGDRLLPAPAAPGPRPRLAGDAHRAERLPDRLGVVLLAGLQHRPRQGRHRLAGHPRRDHGRGSDDGRPRLARPPERADGHRGQRRDRRPDRVALHQRA